MNNKEQYSVILVRNITQALRGEKLLKENQIPYKLIPVPRKFSSDCGVCLRIKTADTERSIQCLTEGNCGYTRVENL